MSARNEIFVVFCSSQVLHAKNNEILNFCALSSLSKTLTLITYEQMTIFPEWVEMEIATRNPIIIFALIKLKSSHFIINVCMMNRQIRDLSPNHHFNELKPALDYYHHLHYRRAQWQRMTAYMCASARVNRMPIYVFVQLTFKATTTTWNRYLSYEYMSALLLFARLCHCHSQCTYISANLIKFFFCLRVR